MCRAVIAGLLDDFAQHPCLRLARWTLGGGWVFLVKDLGDRCRVHELPRSLPAELPSLPAKLLEAGVRVPIQVAVVDLGQGVADRDERHHPPVHYLHQFLQPLAVFLRQPRLVGRRQSCLGHLSILSCLLFECRHRGHEISTAVLQSSHRRLASDPRVANCLPEPSRHILPVSRR